MLEGYGRWHEPDPQDANYPATPLLASQARGWQYWWDLGWWGDQGQTPRCVEYAWWHVLMDGPLTALRAHGLERVATPWLYCEAQKRDAWTGDCDNPQYEGTSVRGAAKALKAHDMILEYRWATSAEEVVRAILAHGPVIMGSRWPAGFSFPDDEGFVDYTEQGNYGHAYVLNGANVERGVVRGKNSWGRDRWGLDGRFWIHLDDLERLFAESWTEACLVVEH